ncbi:MAG TPA: hypothetical protein DHW42_10995, partial [Candidatus Marinimicrobia bacterium]|nr:hypothetical protein [Candidatus Neomarinimicrobiota bacterium]
MEVSLFDGKVSQDELYWLLVIGNWLSVTGSQLRRSSKSVKSNIVEGYGRKNYQKDYIRFMTYSISSNDETIDHLETLWETNSLKNEKLYNDLHEKL